MNPTGLVAVVTGGASGLGRATVERLADLGARVAIVDLDRAGCDTAAAEMGDRAVISVPADVTSAEGSVVAMERVVDLFGPPRILVCCAGIQEGRRVVRTRGPVDLDWFRRSVEVNLVGAFNWIRLVASGAATLEPIDEDGSRGVIVTASSITAWDGIEGGVAYAAAKAGVAGMTLPLARELAPVGIRVMSIAPGPFDTPMVSTMPADYAAVLRATIPHPPRLGRPDEFASLVGHIVENDMLNGEVIRLDGGLRMSPGSLRNPRP